MNIRYRPEIDGMRAFAVIGVIINHCNKDILPGGYLGVDIFFVISGYVITSSLVGRNFVDFNDFISGFYERRIKRLVPALAVFVFVMSIVISFFNPYPILILRTGLTSLLGISNLYLLRQSTDYFGHSAEMNVFTQTWSLGVEEQFYLIFPIIVWFSGFGRNTKNGAKNLFFTVGGLAVASLIGFIYFYSINQPTAYFLMPTRFWEMAIGCLLFILCQKRQSLEKRLQVVPSIFVLGLIILVMYLPMSLAVISTIAVVFLTSVLIISLKKQTLAFKILTHPKIVYIGLISYSLYLWHWGILSLSSWTIGIHWWSLPIQLFLILFLAIGSYKYIETPLRHVSWFGKRWKRLVVGVVAIISQFLGLFVFSKQQNIYLGNNGNIQTHNDFSPYLPMKRLDCTSSKPNEICFSQPIKKNQKTLYFAGDSHTAHLIPMAGIIRKIYETGILISTYKNFPNLIATSGNNPTFSLSKMKREKRKMDELFKKNIGKLKEGDIIVLSSYFDFHLKERSYNLDDPEKKFFFDTNGKPILYSKVFENFKNDFEYWANYALKRGLIIVLFSEIPIFQGLPNTPDVWACTKEWFRPRLHLGCAANFFESKSQIQNRLNDTNELLLSLARENDNVYYFDAFDILCPKQKICSSFVNNIQTYRNNNHLTQEGSEYLAPFFAKFLKVNDLI